MQVILSNLWFLYLTLTCFLFIFLYKTEKYRTGLYNNSFLNKENTNILKGASVIIVFIHHLSLFLSNDHTIINQILRHVGFLAVSIFLFVSGFGLMTQFKKRGEEYFNNFFTYKVLRIFMTFIFSNILVSCLSNLFLNTNYGVIDIIKSSLFMKFADGRELWFIGIIIYYYCAFYFSYHFVKIKKVSFWLLIASFLMWVLINKYFKNGTWYYNSAISFIIGIWVANCHQKIFEYVVKRFSAYVMICSSAFLLVMYLYIFKEFSVLQLLAPPLFIAVIILIVIKCKLKSRFLEFMNSISLEFYLIQIVMMKIFWGNSKSVHSITFFLVFVMTVILSKMLSLLINYIFRLKSYK